MLKDIAELDEGFATTVALVLGFYVIMFALIEVPLVGYLVARPGRRRRPRASASGCARRPRGSPPVASLIVGLFLVVSGIVNIFV